MLRFNCDFLRRFVSIATLTAALWVSFDTHAELKGPDPRFPLLKIGTVEFTNATVVSKAPTYIFLRHNGGLASIKVTDLSLDLREQLGYDVPKPKTNTVAQWTQSQVTRIKAQDLEKVRRDLESRVPGMRFSAPPKLTPAMVAGLLVAVAALHGFFSFCSFLICRKAGFEPGPLIWIPVAQLFPLVRAANMSGWWALAWMVPVLNLVTQVLWSFNIAKARQKSGWVAVLLLLPPTSLFAFLYLAFSSGSVPEKPEPGPQLMTLEAI